MSNSRRQLSPINGPRSNGAVLQELVGEGRIRLTPGSWLSHAPDEIATVGLGERVRGMVLGLAIGDALGGPTESMLPEARRQMFGEIRDYVPSRLSRERRGFPTDDSQLALWTLDQVNRDHGLDPENLLRRFASRRIFGSGATVREALQRFHSGVPWGECGVESAGNGALMRIAPALIPHIARPSSDLWADVALATFITHNDRAALATSLAFVDLLWELLRMQRPPSSDWWAERFLDSLRQIDPQCEYSPRVTGRESDKKPFWRLVGDWIREARIEQFTALQACERWHSGAYLLETVPSVLYILMGHGHDPEEAIVRAVNDTKDNDTTAAIVGAAVGALHGERALPGRWIEGLSGRTVENDDGRIWEILDEAEAAWGY